MIKIFRKYWSTAEGKIITTWYVVYLIYGPCVRWMHLTGALKYMYTKYRMNGATRLIKQ